MIKKISEIVNDIFFEENRVFQRKAFVRNLTEHYKKEFREFSLDGVFVWEHYSVLEKDLELYKYQSERTFVELFSSILEEIYNSREFKNTLSKIGDNVEVIWSPVPMHWTRYFYRWFNHIDFLGKYFCKKQSLPYQSLLKTWFSKRQSHLSREMRLENRRNSFTMKPRVSIPKIVILIDDVISTWATVHECGKVLKSQGVKHVIGVFLASNSH
jgi:predicted amidophosphoribosyltransferase